MPPPPPPPRTKWTRRVPHPVLIGHAASCRRTLELFDLLEPMCMDTYHRHADFPELHYAVCQEMWEEDDEGLMRALAAGGAGAARADAQRAVCAETFKYCKAGEISGEEEGGEL